MHNAGDAQCVRCSFKRNCTFTELKNGDFKGSGEILASPAQWEDFPAFCSAASSHSRLSEKFSVILKFRSIWSVFGNGLGYLRRSCSFTGGRTEACARALTRSSARRCGAVQQRKMAHFLALFLTAAYERSRARARAACICRGHGSGCGARTRARSGALRAHVFFWFFSTSSSSSSRDDEEKNRQTSPSAGLKCRATVFFGILKPPGTLTPTDYSGIYRKARMSFHS